MTSLAMTLATRLWAALPQAVKSPDPSTVKPGWIALFIVLALGVAVAFLGMSLRKHLGRVNFEEEPAPDEAPVTPPDDAG
jgi:hypothetical protein